MRIPVNVLPEGLYGAEHTTIERPGVYHNLHGGHGRGFRSVHMVDVLILLSSLHMPLETLP